MLEISYFKFRTEFEKTEIKILNRSLNFVTEMKLKLFIDWINEFEQNLPKKFNQYCFTMSHSVKDCEIPHKTILFSVFSVEYFA